MPEYRVTITKVRIVEAPDPDSAVARALEWNRAPVEVTVELIDDPDEAGASAPLAATSKSQET